MKEKENEIPLLDLAPKLKRPLSLWNPLDYLRLLFWVFFFPQAIRWYVQTFSKPEYRNINEFKNFKEFRKVVWNDPILGKLILQAFITILIAAPGICLILRAFNVPINWFGVVLGVALGVVGGVALCVALGVAGGVQKVLVGIVAGAVTLGLVGIMFAGVFGVARGVAFGAAGGMGFGAAVVMLVILVRTWSIVVSEGVDISVAVDMVSRETRVEAFSVAAGIASIAIIMRLSEYVYTTLHLAFFPKAKKIKCLPQLGRIVFLPLPGIQKQLEYQLDTNWETGVKNANQLLEYSHQFIPAVKAIRLKLEQSSRDVMLSRISTLAIKPYDWKLLPALSKKPMNIYWKFKLVPHLNTPANAACAGFWFWHKKESHKAVKAFSAVQDLRHGAEIYDIAKVIDKGINTTDMQTIAAMEVETNWLDSLPDPELRTGTLRALRIIHAVAGEARVALNARALLNRSTAINRAVADLTDLMETGSDFCPEPEWPLIQDIAHQWKEIFSRAGGVIGEEVLRQPILNPYEGYSGLPVTGSTFTGRADILRQIETHWAIGGLMPVLILYGHRRMGKTSVLRSLAKNTDANNLYVYLDMQNAGWVEHTGQLLLDFAEAVHKIASNSGLDIGAPLPPQIIRPSTLHAALSTLSWNESMNACAKANA